MNALAALFVSWFIVSAGGSVSLLSGSFNNTRAAKNYSLAALIAVIRAFVSVQVNVTLFILDY